MRDGDIAAQIPGIASMKISLNQVSRELTEKLIAFGETLSPGSEAFFRLTVCWLAKRLWPECDVDEMDLIDWDNSAMFGAPAYDDDVWIPSYTPAQADFPQPLLTTEGVAVTWYREIDVLVYSRSASSSKYAGNVENWQEIDYHEGLADPWAGFEDEMSKGCETCDHEECGICPYRED